MKKEGNWFITPLFLLKGFSMELTYYILAIGIFYIMIGPADDFPLLRRIIPAWAGFCGLAALYFYGR